MLHQNCPDIPVPPNASSLRAGSLPVLHRAQQRGGAPNRAVAGISKNSCVLEKENEGKNFNFFTLKLVLIQM